MYPRSCILEAIGTLFIGIVVIGFMATLIFLFIVSHVTRVI